MTSTWLIGGGGAALVILLAGAAFVWRRHDLARHGPDYRRLAREVGLSRWDALWIDRLARRGGLLNGAGLLLGRGAFDHYAAAMIGRRRARADRLRSQLFVETAD
ncbi:MAG: hypothetical protein ACF8PN_05705 [Phycisphaerales bacterium]